MLLALSVLLRSERREGIRGIVTLPAAVRPVTLNLRGSPPCFRYVPAYNHPHSGRAVFPTHAGGHPLPGQALSKAEDKDLPGEIIVYGGDIVLQGVPLPNAPGQLVLNDGADIIGFRTQFPEAAGVHVNFLVEPVELAQILQRQTLSPVLLGFVDIVTHARGV